jgi:hypothetical protein
LRLEVLQVNSAHVFKTAQLIKCSGGFSGNGMATIPKRACKLLIIGLLGRTSAFFGVPHNLTVKTQFDEKMVGDEGFEPPTHSV